SGNSPALNRPPAQSPTETAGIQVAARHVTNSERHGQHGQTKCQRNANKPDPKLRKGGGQHSCTAAQNQPCRSNEFCGNLSDHCAILPARSRDDATPCGVSLATLPSARRHVFEQDCLIPIKQHKLATE